MADTIAKVDMREVRISTNVILSRFIPFSIFVTKPRKSFETRACTYG